MSAGTWVPGSGSALTAPHPVGYPDPKKMRPGCNSRNRTRCCTYCSTALHVRARGGTSNPLYSYAYRKRHFRDDRNNCCRAVLRINVNMYYQECYWGYLEQAVLLLSAVQVPGTRYDINQRGHHRATAHSRSNQQSVRPPHVALWRANAAISYEYVPTRVRVQSSTRAFMPQDLTEKRLFFVARLPVGRVKCGHSLLISTRTAVLRRPA